MYIYKDLRKRRAEGLVAARRGQAVQVRRSTRGAITSTSRTDDGAPNRRVCAIDPASRRAPTGRRSSPSARTRRSTASTSSAACSRSTYLKDVRLAPRDARSRRQARARDHAPHEGQRLVTLRQPRRATRRYYTFTSFTYPTEIYETSVKTGADEAPLPAERRRSIRRSTSSSRLFADVEGRHARALLRGARRRTSRRTARPTLVYGYGGFLVTQKPALHVVGVSVARARRHLRGRQPARRRRVRRGVAPGRHAARRSRTSSTICTRCSRSSSADGVHDERQHRRARRVERRPPRRGGRRRSAPSSSRVGALRRAARRHGALPPLRHRQDVGRGVRLGGRSGGLQGRSTPTRRTSTSRRERSTRRCWC